MLFELILWPFWLLVKSIIGLIPNMVATTVNLAGFISILDYGIHLFGANTFGMVITNVIFWSTIDLGWAITEWIYKKIPGIK